MEVFIAQVTGADFVYSENDSDLEKDECIVAYWGSSSTLPEAMESLATNILSSGPSTETRLAVIMIMISHIFKA